MKVAEALVLAAVGAAMSAWVGDVLGGPGWAMALGTVGAINGAVSGWNRIYNWQRYTGWVGFVLDSTWALFGTTLAGLLHGAQFFTSAPNYRADRSHRFDAHLYENGVALKKGYAFTHGNVISGAGGSSGLGDDDRGVRRLRFIGNHELLHVWQNRMFGPLYQIIYVGWLIVGAIGALIYWLFHRKDLARLVEAAAYFDNPFEYWAYRRDNYWPPRDAHPALLWPPKAQDIETPTIT